MDKRVEENKRVKKQICAAFFGLSLIHILNKAHVVVSGYKQLVDYWLFPAA